MEIDLHGVKHENVGSLLDKTIWEGMNKNYSTIRIITGNSREMKRIVNEIADEYGFMVNDEWGNSAAMIMSLI